MIPNFRCFPFHDLQDFLFLVWCFFQFSSDGKSLVYIFFNISFISIYSLIIFKYIVKWFFAISSLYALATAALLHKIIPCLFYLDCSNNTSPSSMHMEHYLDLVLFLLAQKLEENWHQSTILHFCTDFHQFLSRLFPGNSISWVSLHWLFHMNYTVFLFLKMGVATLSTWTAQWLMAFLWHWKTFHHVWWFSLASH